MFITIYKKIKGNELYLIRFELVGNKFRKWRGQKDRINKASKWKEYSGDTFHTGNAKASLAMFKEINTLINKGYSIYKKKSKEIKTIKPFIRIRKYNYNTIKKLYQEGNLLYFISYLGVLTVLRTNGNVHNNETRKKISCEDHPCVSKQTLGYCINNKFFLLPLGTQGSPAEINLWRDYAKTNNIKILIKIKDRYYA